MKKTETEKRLDQLIRARNNITKDINNLQKMKENIVQEIIEIEKGEKIFKEKNENQNIR